MEGRTGCRDAQSAGSEGLGTLSRGDGAPGSAPCRGSAAALGQEPGEARGRAERRQCRQHAGSRGDTNLWPRSPGCVQGKLLARDTGREKRNRESKEGGDSPGVLQDKEGTGGHVPSRRQGVTAWERPAAPRTSAEPLSALQGGDVARGALHPNPSSAGLLPSLASPSEHTEPNKPGLDSHQPSKCPDNPSERVTWTQPCGW